MYGNKEEISKLNKTVIGTGPYRLKEYEIGSKLILEANPNWWGRALPENRHKFNFDIINVKFIGDDHAKIENLETGGIDFALLKLDSYLHRINGKNWGKTVFAKRTTHQGVFTTQTSFFWNLRLPIFKRKTTREALQLLLNREMMNDKINGGLSKFATGPWNSFSYYSDPDIKPIRYNPQKALQLLQQDGWKDSNQNGIIDKEIEGKLHEFRFTILYTIKDWEKYITIYQADLKKVGIQLDAQFLEWNLFIKNMEDLKFEAYIIGRGFPGVIDFNPKKEWHSAFISKHDSNVIGYQNKEVDRILEKAELEVDRKKRAKLLRQAYRVISKDSPMLFWMNSPFSVFAHSKRIKMEKTSYKYSLGMDYWWIED